MSYSYQTERPWLFTEEGSVCLIKARDNAFKLLDLAGAFKGFQALDKVNYGDTWKGMALLDRMVEMKDIIEITGHDVWGQDRIFSRPMRGR